MVDVIGEYELYFNLSSFFFSISNLILYLECLSYELKQNYWLIAKKETKMTKYFRIYEEINYVVLLIINKNY